MIMTQGQRFKNHGRRESHSPANGNWRAIFSERSESRRTDFASEASISERIWRAKRISANGNLASEASFSERIWRATGFKPWMIQSLSCAFVRKKKRNIHPLCIYKAYTISRLIKNPKKNFACGACLMFFFY